MNVDKIINVKYSQNIYLVSDDDNNCFIVDPGAQGQDIIAYIENRDLKPLYIILTHGHFDHIGAVKEVRDHFDIDLLAPKKEEELLKDPALNYTSRVGKGIELVADRYLEDGEEVDFGSEKIKVISTPGHTAGSTCYLVDNKLFSGDTLFKNSVGRDDLPTGNHEELLESVKILKELDDNIEVFAGHGDPTTIEAEKTYNPYFK
ncbi:MAG: MBL fold metallo-hydrolase [Finegoldia sp.]|nr:MBL fold metallo-hydrolase [Finegoldia sp.]